jgi:hypothetical protein
MQQQLEFDLDHLFIYHAPTPEQVEQYQRIRDAAKEFARVVIENTPPSADQSTAIRKLRECVHVANAAIALDGRIYRKVTGV